MCWTSSRSLDERAHRLSAGRETGDSLILTSGELAKPSRPPHCRAGSRDSSSSVQAISKAGTPSSDCSIATATIQLSPDGLAAVNSYSVPPDPPPSSRTAKIAVVASASSRFCANAGRTSATDTLIVRGERRSPVSENEKPLSRAVSAKPAGRDSASPFLWIRCLSKRTLTFGPS